MCDNDDVDGDDGNKNDIVEIIMPPLPSVAAGVAAVVDRLLLIFPLKYVTMNTNADVNAHETRKRYFVASFT